MNEKKHLTYAEAGVDIERGDEATRKIKKLIESTYNARVIGGFGHFGGCFSGRFEGIEEPVLVSSADGVGTKIKIACMLKKYDTVGLDIVHHCVNDIAVMGAQPLYFLDYIGLGRLEPGTVEEIVGGLAAGCRNAGTALIAGETAEMPDIYNEGEFDLAGFIVGLVDRKKIIDGANIVTGDKIYGFPSSGLHTNGYTLARKIAFEAAGWAPDHYIDELGDTIGDALLTPHKLYLDIIAGLREREFVRGFAHVTGGGIAGNLSRIMPAGLTFRIDTGSWQVPKIFGLLQKHGNVETAEMFHAFNMGIGLLCVVDRRADDDLFSGMEGDDRPVLIGEVIKGDKPQLNF